MNPINFLIGSLLPLLPRWSVKPFAKPYVAGETMEEALDHITSLNKKGFAATVDILGEHVQTFDEALRVTLTYVDLLNSINENNLNCNLSIKPTHIGLDLGYDIAKENLFTLLRKASDTNNFVRIDMESSPYTDASIKLYLDALLKYSNVGPVIQAYLHRSPKDIQRLKSDKLNVRICKGIYKEPEHMAFQSSKKINEQFFELVKTVLNVNGYVGIATHDISLVNEIDEWITANQFSKDQFEFQTLYGVPMGGKLEELLEKGFKVRQYVPFGEEWYNYSVRRLKENPKIITYVLKNIFKS